MSGVIEVLVPLAAGALAWYWASRQQRGSGAWAAGTGVASLVFIIMRIVARADTDQPVFSPSGPGLEEHIYVVNADGTGRGQLSTSAGHYSDPDWSPDGRSIAFAASGLAGGIYVIGADGTDVRRLTWGARIADSCPKWSPDGAKVAFVRWDPSGPDTVWVINRDGSGLTQVVQDSSIDDPAWSPDGSRLSYSVYGGEVSHVCVVNADGSGKLTITAPTGRGSSPTWAPDSQRLAFDAWGGQASLYTAKGDGTGVAPVGTGAYANEPAWSPKGHKIAFLGGSRLFVMNADGTGETALTPAGRYDIFGGPAWSPDGRKLAFWAYPTGAPYPDLYVLNADGTGLNAVATLLLGEPAERKMDLTSPFVWQKLRSLRHPANWGGLADLFTTRSWTSPSGFCWSPDSTMLAFVSRARPRPGTRVLSVVLNLLAVPFFALCGPAAIVLSLRTWWRQGPIPGTVTGLLAGGIATVIYGLLLVLIVGAMCAG